MATAPKNLTPRKMAMQELLRAVVLQILCAWMLLSRQAYAGTLSRDHYMDNMKPRHFVFG